MKGNYYSAILFYGIHFYFITLFEVLFYIYYILPYEQQIIIGLFDLNLDDQLFITKYNITFQPTEFYQSQHCKKDIQQIIQANRPLFFYCYYYIVFIHVCLLLLFCYDIYIVYLKSENKKIVIANTFPLIIIPPDVTLPVVTLPDVTHNVMSVVRGGSSNSSFSSIELNDNENMEIEEWNIENFIPPSNELTNKNNVKCLNYYWNHSKFIAEIIRSFYFILFVGMFEYLFFTQIVNQFKIFDLESILCHLLNNY